MPFVVLTSVSLEVSSWNPESGSALQEFLILLHVFMFTDRINWLPSRIPTEVLFLILGFLKSKQSLILSSTCRRLRGIVGSHFQTILRQNQDKLNASVRESLLPERLTPPDFISFGSLTPCDSFRQKRVVTTAEILSHPAAYSLPIKMQLASHRSHRTGQEYSLSLWIKCYIPADFKYPRTFSSGSDGCVVGVQDHMLPESIARSHIMRHRGLLNPNPNVISLEGGRVFATFSKNPIVSATKVDDGKWHHVALSKDVQGYQSLYVDGKCEGTVYFGDQGFYRDTLRTKQWQIGNGVVFNSSVGVQQKPFLGSVCYLKMFNRRIKETEVERIYKRQKRDIDKGECGSWTAKLVEMLEESSEMARTAKRLEDWEQWSPNRHRMPAPVVAPPPVAPPPLPIVPPIAPQVPLLHELQPLIQPLPPLNNLGPYYVPQNHAFSPQQQPLLFDFGPP
ncbi:UNVERIFIED_CONTAM: hypothetical protein HDU68_004908, partial [Siphonaria sp. JEL0065]